MIEGNFFTGSSSKRHNAELSLTNGLLLVKDTVSNQVLLQLNLPTLAISARVGNTVRAISFDDGSKFETLDNDAVDSLQAEVAPSKQQWLYWLENHYPMMMAMLASIIVITWLSIQYGIPAGAKWLAYKVPASLYAGSGDNTLKYMDKSILNPSQLPEQRQQALREKFLSLIDQTSLSIPIRVEFRNSDLMGANAFALPSGMIVFTDDMVNLSCDDQELTAIFGHELGHIEYRHTVRSMIQSSVIAFTTVMLVGDASFLGEVVVGLPTFLLEMDYSRDFEREADDYAYHFLQTNNINPGFFTSIMNRMETVHRPTDSANSEQADLDRVEGYFSSHPLTEQRIQQFGEAAVQCEM